MLLLLLVSVIFWDVNSQILPGVTIERDSVCVGDDLSYLANCSTGSVIAVKDIQAGAKLVSGGCPVFFNATADPSCCMVNDSDCNFRLGNIAYSNWFAQCSGKKICSQGGAQQETTSNSKCDTNDSLSVYGQYAQYLYMDYYCVNESTKHPMCTSVSETYMGQTAFLTNRNYPSDIAGGDTNCTCSVELDDCDASIQLYTLHLELNEINGTCGHQRLNINYGGTIQELTCGENSSQGISVQQLNTNYITLNMLNTAQETGGKFWIGFGTSNSSTNLEIKCPMDSPKLTCTTTTTSTTISATTTTATTSTTMTTPSSTTMTTSPTTTTPTTPTSTTMATSSTTTRRTTSSSTTITTFRNTTVSTTPTSTTTPLPTSPSPVLPIAPSSASSAVDSDGDNIALIVGISILAVTNVALVICLLVCCIVFRRRFKRHDAEIANVRKLATETSSSDTHRNQQPFHQDYATINNGLSQAATENESNNDTVDSLEINRTETETSIKCISDDDIQADKVLPAEETSDETNNLNTMASNVPYGKKVKEIKTLQSDDSKSKASFNASKTDESNLNSKRKGLKRHASQNRGIKSAESIKSKPGEIMSPRNKEDLSTQKSNDQSIRKGKDNKIKVANISQSRGNKSTEKIKSKPGQIMTPTNKEDLSTQNTNDENISKQKEHEVKEANISEVNELMDDETKSKLVEDSYTKHPGDIEEGDENNTQVKSLHSHTDSDTEYLIKEENTTQEMIVYPNSKPNRIKRRKTNICKDGHSAETKRYLRLYSLLSSFLEYTWTKKEPLKRKKAIHLKTEDTISNAHPTNKTLIPKSADIKHRSIKECEHKSAIAPTCESLEKDVISYNEPGQAKHISCHSRKKLLRSKRIRPLGDAQKRPVARKIKPHRLCRPYWTDSKF